MAITPHIIQRGYKMQIYLVHDIKANTYGAPLFFENNVEAIRSLEQATQDSKTQLNKYPSDYNLLHIGHYNKETGTINSQEPTTLANCSQFLQ